MQTQTSGINDSLLMAEHGMEISNGNLKELFRVMQIALTTYSNVHRGSGYYSVITTHLMEKARELVLAYAGCDKKRWSAIFCSPDRASAFTSILPPDSYKVFSSDDFGISLGIRAVVVKQAALPKGTPGQTGGGTARLFAADWIIWTNEEARFEAGTPAIINILAFARALQLSKANQDRKDLFQEGSSITAEDVFCDLPCEGLSGSELLEYIRETTIGNNNVVPTVKQARKYINLDNGASTLSFLPVWNTVKKAILAPSSAHVSIVSRSRSICLDFLGAAEAEYELIFTRNATEATNLVSESTGSCSSDEGRVVLTTILEHSSNDLPWRFTKGTSLVRTGMDENGFADSLELEKNLIEYNGEPKHGDQRIILVAVTAASNVLGTCNDIERISSLAHRYGAEILVDASQYVAHRKTDAGSWNADYVVFSAHKIYAPFGTGVLLARKGLLHLSADRMNEIKRSGEENRAGIAALGMALKTLSKIGFSLIENEENIILRKAISGLNGIPGAVVFGPDDPASGDFKKRDGLIVFTLPKVWPNVMAKLLSERGIGIRYGCHCAHMLVKKLLNVKPWLEKFQHVIFSLFHGISAPGIVRISMGLLNNEEDIDIFLKEITDIAGMKKADRGKRKLESEEYNKVIRKRKLEAEMVVFTSIQNS